MADTGRLARVTDRALITLMYAPVRIVASVGGAMLASAIFGRVWKALNGKQDVPDAIDKAKGWGDILPAALLHGMVFAGVKALVDRASAKGFERLTGRWPGEVPPA